MLGQVQSVGAADDEAQVAPAHPPLLEEAAEADAVVLPAAGVEQDRERALGDPLLELLVLAHLDQLEPRVARQHALVVLHVVGERRPQPADCEHEDPHVRGLEGER